jgi:DNA-binding transcriptional LysR family regulator
LILLLQSQSVIDLSARYLRAFLAVSDELHFGRAAERLGIAQSALSQQIRRLEDTVGIELLTRTSRRVALTPAGLEMRAGAERLLGDLDRTIQRARAANAGQVGTVTVGSQAAALNSLVPDIISALAQRAPELRVHLRQLTSEEQAAGLLTGAIDLGLVREVDRRSGLQLETLLDEPVHAVLASTHRLAGRATIDLAELADEPFVLWRRIGSPAYFDDITAACRAAGFSPRIAYEMRGSQARQGLVAAGLGVSLEAASHADSGHRGVRFVPLTGRPITARIQLAWAPARPDPRRDLVLRVARETAHRPSP